MTYNILCNLDGVVSHFCDSEGHQTLSDFNPIVEVYPIGRLDVYCEKLLLLTNESKLNHRLNDPEWFFGEL